MRVASGMVCLTYDNRTKYLFFYDFHVGLCIREHSRLNEVAIVSVAIAAAHYSRALLLASLDIPDDTLLLELRNLGTLCNCMIERISNFHALDVFVEGLRKLIIDA
jgi:hypothetical protein